MALIRITFMMVSECRIFSRSIILLHKQILRYLSPAESLFVDWVGVNGTFLENAGDIYIPTKGLCGGGVGKIPVSVHRDLQPGQVVWDYGMAMVVRDPPVQGAINMTCSDPAFREWTGADLRRDGRLLILIRGGPPASVYFFPRPPDQSIATALSRYPCHFVANSEIDLLPTGRSKYEAVAFVDRSGLQFAEMSECIGNCIPPLFQYNLLYPHGSWP